ncbi:uncharacterized protein LOC135489000 isoform X2 [Lineus longissimus]|uniref:uncharacterized protein LOC135489000 isoform X2 n=1 Tax=Lineus longissimus TaxID=88925 RepID=UPI002B4F9225
MLISFENSIEIIRCTDHTPGEIYQFINMGQGDEPPAKKCKWKWDADDVSSVPNKCLSDIGNRSRPELIMRRRSSEEFFQREEIITDELPDLAVDTKLKSIRNKHPSPLDKTKHRHSSKHRTEHKSEKHRIPSRSDSVNSEKHRLSHRHHSEKHRKSEKQRTKSQECDSSSQKHVSSNKHRHMSDQSHELRMSDKKDMKEKRPSSSDHKHRHSNQSHSHHQHRHKHKIKDETARNDVKLHVSVGSHCNDGGIKQDKKVIRRHSDSLGKEQFLKNNELGLSCRGCISPRVLIEKRDCGGFGYGKNLLSDFLRTGGSGKVESDITCAQIDTCTEIEYERDTDRDSCDGRSDNVSSTNMNFGPAGANLNIKFKMTAEKKQQLASALKRVHIPSNASWDNSNLDSKRVRRVSADTSTNLIRLPSLPASDCTSDCGSVSSITNRHFLDALSDVQDDCVSITSGDKREDRAASVTKPQLNMASDQRQNEMSLRIGEFSDDRLASVPSPVAEVTIVPPGPNVKIQKTDPKIKAQKAELKLKTDDVRKSETPALHLHKSVTLSEICAPKTSVSLPDSDELLIPGRTVVTLPVLTEEDTHRAEGLVEELEGMVADKLPEEDFCNVESDSEDFHSCLVSPCASNSIDTDRLPGLEASVCSIKPFEDDIFKEPSSSLCGDGRVIHVPSCHPCVTSFSNLQSTSEFTAMHSKSVDANFQEGHDGDAQDFCNVESDSEDFHSCLVSPCASNSIDTDSLPDLEAPVCSINPFEDDIFKEPSSSLCGDGRVIHVPSCHPCVTSFLNLRSTYEFTAMHSNSVDANFQEGHDGDALDLMHDFTTSVRGPTRHLLEKVVNDVLCENKSDLKCQGYDLLMCVQQLHPPDHRCPFPRSFMSDVMDRCEKLLKGGGADAHNSDILGIILAVQYCTSSLEAELMSRKLGSRREMAKSIIARWFSLETSYGHVEELTSWLKLAVEFDDLVKSRCQSASDDDDANALGFHMSLLGEIHKLLCLVIAVSTEPSMHCARVSRSLYQVMDQEVDAAGEKIRCSVSSPLLSMKVLELLSGDVASLCNMSEDFGKSCMVAELCYVADYFLAQWRVEEENLEMPLYRRVLESCRPDHRKTAEMIEKFLVNVKNENSDLEDDVYIAQLECQLEALNLDPDLTNNS